MDYGAGRNVCPSRFFSRSRISLEKLLNLHGNEDHHGKSKNSKKLGKSQGLCLKIGFKIGTYTVAI
jgi:hypothetical protein